MPSKELTHEVATFLRHISVSSENGGSFAEHECKEKAEELLSTILAALQEPSEGMMVAGAGPAIFQGAAHCWRAMLAASALGEQSE